MTVDWIKFLIWVSVLAMCALAWVTLLTLLGVIR
jgi:hypothetical protein